MYNKIIRYLKGVLYNMGLLSGVKDLQEFKDIDIDEEHYRLIDQWNQLYKGYYEDWHDVDYHTLSGKKSRRMHTLNMGKHLSAEMASLVFNEQCEINLSDETLSENVHNVLSDNKFYREFQRYLEYGFATGGFVLKVYATDGDIKIGYVTADCFYPTEYTNGKIKGGLFVNETKKGKDYYTLLERHMWDGSE